MAPDTLRSLLTGTPFEPFRIVMSDGKAYDIRHPDLLWVGLNTAHVGVTGNLDQGIWERFVILDARHITRVEPLPLPTPSSTNGAG
jgi:hypothetical protein